MTVFYKRFESNNFYISKLTSLRVLASFVPHKKKTTGVRDEGRIVLTREEGSGRATSFLCNVVHYGSERGVDAHTMEREVGGVRQEALTEEGCKCHV